jgi:hypothetical protein
MHVADLHVGFAADDRSSKGSSTPQTKQGEAEGANAWLTDLLAPAQLLCETFMAKTDRRTSDMLASDC